MDGCYRFTTMYESTSFQCMPVLGFHHGRMHGSFDSSDNKLSDFQWNIYTFFYIHALNDKFDEGGLFYYIKVPLPPEGIFFLHNIHFNFSNLDDRSATV